MANIALAIFLILLGITMLVSTEIPKWVIGLAAVVTGIIIGLCGWSNRKSP